MAKMIVQGRSSVIIEADHAGQHEHIEPTGETTTVLVQDGDPIEVPKASNLDMAIRYPTPRRP